jgi:DNA-directed RNA polymerase specialized sigma subunit
VYNFSKYNDYELVYLLQWHSEEAWDILLVKYGIFIVAKLKRYQIPHHVFEDYVQECKTEVCFAIKKYDECFGKTLCKYLELIIERKILRMLNKEKLYLSSLVKVDDFDSFKTCENIEKEAIYEQEIKRIREVKLSSVKQNILKEIIIDGTSIKDYSEKYNLTRKEVYNQLYGLRVIFRKKL